MKRLILLAIWLVGLASVAVAQSGGPDIADWCICLADNSCDDASSCGQATTCATTTFTVPANGTYLVSGSTECSAGGSCKHCRVCVRISYNQGNFPWCDNGDATTGNCESSCLASCSSVVLHPDITYTLTVCKLPCLRGGYFCTDCGANCRAVGCVKNWSGAKCSDP